MAGRKQNMAPMWKKLMNLVDLGEPTSFLDHVYIWDALNVNANRTKLLLTNTETCSNHEVLLGQTKNLPGWEKPHAKTVAWSYDLEGRAQKCVERCCELVNKKVEQLLKVTSPSLDDHNFKKELESVGEL